MSHPVIQRLKWIGIQSVIGSLIFGQSATNWAEDDFRTRHTLEISKRFGSQWEIFLLPEIRTRNDASDLFYHEFRQGIRWKPSSHLQLGLNYLFARNASTDKPLNEHTAELDITPKTKWGPLELSLRWRGSLRTIQGKKSDEEFQMRLMPKIVWPTKLLDHKIMPFIADDPFYDFGLDSIVQNWLFIGVSIPLEKLHYPEMNVDFYYLLEHQRGVIDDWNLNHVFGTKLSIKF